MPVDTHVFRVSKRLGLIGPKVNADQAHEVFATITPPEWIYPLHVNLIRHGRQVCHAQRPNCMQCTLYRECAYVWNFHCLFFVFILWKEVFLWKSLQSCFLSLWHSLSLAESMSTIGSIETEHLRNQQIEKGGKWAHWNASRRDTGANDIKMPSMLPYTL